MEPIVDRVSVLELLYELVGTESVNPSLDPAGAGEAAVAERVSQRLAEWDLEVRVVDPAGSRPSVLARWPGTGDGPSLMFNGHLDTMPLARPRHPLLGTSSLHCGELRGGTGWSSIADSCLLRVEFRTLPAWRRS